MTEKIHSNSLINSKSEKSKADLTKKNLEACAATAEFLDSERIRNCEGNTQFVVITHKAVKGGVVKVFLLMITGKLKFLEIYGKNEEMKI